VLARVEGKRNEQAPALRTNNAEGFPGIGLVIQCITGRGLKNITLENQHRTAPRPSGRGA
jgi:hypothetical protein